MVQMALESPTDHRQVERFCQEYCHKSLAPLP